MRLNFEVHITLSQVQLLGYTYTTQSKTAILGSTKKHMEEFLIFI